MTQRSWLKFVASLGALGALLAFSNHIRKANDPTKWIREVTAIDLSQAGDSVQWRQEDVGVAGFGTLTTDVFASLVNAHPFLPCESDPLSTPWGRLFEVRELPADSYPPAPELLEIHGASQWQSWRCYLHPSSRRIWIVVLHPDYSGDPPAGSFEPGREATSE